MGSGRQQAESTANGVGKALRTEELEASQDDKGSGGRSQGPVGRDGHRMGPERRHRACGPRGGGRTAGVFCAETTVLGQRGHKEALRPRACMLPPTH